MTPDRRVEEILEHVWTEREVGRDSAKGILAAAASEHAPDAHESDLHDLAAGCRAVCCPSCGYGFPQETGLAGRLRRLMDRFEERRARKA